MHQVVVYPDGKIKVEEVPTPQLKSNGILVRNSASVVSAGTERMRVEFAQKTLIGKAMERKDQVKLLLENIRREGILATYRKVKQELSTPLTLGYSCAGKVVEVGSDVDDIKPGDKVACGGVTANHAEFVFVPKNLCVKIPDGVNYEEAAFATIGAIAMQGIRQLSPVIGDKICIIGLGLIGLLTVQILKSCGNYVVGVDIDEFKLNLAKTLGADEAILPEEVTSIAKSLSLIHI